MQQTWKILPLALGMNIQSSSANNLILAMNLQSFKVSWKVCLHLVSFSVLLIVSSLRLLCQLICTFPHYHHHQKKKKSALLGKCDNRWICNDTHGFLAVVHLLVYGWIISFTSSTYPNIHASINWSKLKFCNRQWHNKTFLIITIINIFLNE